MKITNEKMRDELTRLYTDYAREREKQKKKLKKMESGQKLDLILISTYLRN